MEAILLRQVACRCAGRAFGEAIVCLAGTNWCHNDVDKVLHPGRSDIMTTSSVRWVGWTSSFFFPQTIF